MPRLSICLNPNDPKQNYENENVDFCQRCWETHVFAADELDALEIMKVSGCSKELVEKALAIEDRISGCDHPDYDETDYTCACCARTLKSKDN